MVPYDNLMMITCKLKSDIILPFSLPKPEYKSCIIQSSLMVKFLSLKFQFLFIILESIKKYINLWFLDIT